MTARRNGSDSTDRRADGSFDATGGRGRSGRSGWTLALVCTTTFMLVLDITVVAVALPDMQRNLNASLDQLQWVIDAYTLMLAAFLLTAATLGDRVGRRPLFLLGTGIFTAGSLMCGLAPTPDALDLFRALQGVGGAVLLGIGIPLLADAYPLGRARNLAIGVYGAVSGGAVAVGPLVGGVLTDGFGWRAIFWINVPVGLVALVVSRTRLVGQRTHATRRVDWLGTTLVTLALFLLVFALVRGNNDGWGSLEILSMLIGSLIAIVAFAWVELRVRDPVVDLSLFKRPTYTVSVVVGFVVQATLVASTTYLSLYAQNTLGYSPFDTGLRFLPFSLLAFASGALVAPVLSRVAPRWLLAGTAACTALSLALMAHLGPASRWTDLIPGFVLGGIGLGTAATILNQLSVAGVSESRSGMASGVSVAMRQVGVAAGTAGLGVLYERTITSRMLTALAATPAIDPVHARQVAGSVADGNGVLVAQAFPAPLQPAVAHAAIVATTAGLDRILSLGAIVVAATAVAAAIFTGSRDPSTGGRVGGDTPSPRVASEDDRIQWSGAGKPPEG
jgi:EmrB/QacA subfamily drug resistance transporter